MSSVAEKTDPELWEKVKTKVTRSEKGGHAGEWSARKAQLATQEYKKEGGRYRGKKAADNHLQQWTDERWGTKSGEKSAETGERYLPENAIRHLSPDEYRATTAKKRADTRKGKQFSPQPKAVAAKTAKDRLSGHAGAGRSRAPTKSQLMDRARAKGVAGCSRMTKAQLQAAIA